MLLFARKAAMILEMMEVALLIPDSHRPYHDVRAYDLMLKVAKDINPDEIVILGDYADFYSVSSHTKDPRVLHMLAEEIEDVIAGLNQLDELFPKANKVFLEGNHEFRLERYLIDKAPALFGVTSIPHLFEFNRRKNWKFKPYGPNQVYSVLGSYLNARHEPLARTAELTAKKAMASIVYGHIHRIQSSYAVGMNGVQHVAFSCGWLGDKRKDKIFSYVKTHHDWQLGFAIVYVDRKTKFFYHNVIQIMENYSCVVNGKRYQG